MNTSANGIAFITRHEGLRLRAYRDSGGVWTVGYGHTGGVSKGMCITQAEAEEFLKQDLRRAEAEVNRQLPAMLNQNQFDALVSLAFNIGTGNLRSSTLMRKAKANAGDPAIAAEFAKWKNVRINGKLEPLPGLIKRRKDEAELYFTPIANDDEE